MFTKAFTIGPESCAASTPATDPRPMLQVAKRRLRRSGA
jgi:hypothetical protein